MYTYTYKLIVHIIVQLNPAYIGIGYQWCKGAAEEETFIQQRQEYSRSRNAVVAAYAVYLLRKKWIDRSLETRDKA